MTLKYVLNILIFFIGFLIYGQVTEEVMEPDYIKTITFKSNTNEGELPVLKLNEPLTLEFDVLNAEEDDFYYVIEHYDFDWQPSRMRKVEYLQGLDNQRIFDYENSFNTYQIYSHYRLTIPNRQTRLKISGNYMIKIFDDYGDLMFSRKFMVYEEIANVGVNIRRSRDVKYLAQKQSVDFTISSPIMRFPNPERTIKTLVIQNNNLNTAISDLKPQYTMGSQLIYRYNTESSFWGGNEYLFFETKDVRSANVGVQFIELKDLYNSYLFTDVIRATQPYTYNPDINGNFFITAIDREDPSIEGDYTQVHFSLQHPELFGDEIYVYGNYNNYALTEYNKMTFNPDSELYELTMKMKQGFYNYKYVILRQDGSLDEGAISGNYDFTENNYKVLVYFRDLGARYDRIIGLGESSSINMTN